MANTFRVGKGGGRIKRKEIIVNTLQDEGRWTDMKKNKVGTEIAFFLYI
jgi:hypothetical protein